LLLETISTMTVGLALVVLVLVAGLRGRWHLGVRAVIAVLGALLSSEVLKYVLPNVNHWTGHWHWLSTGSFPSGHAVIVTSIALAVLSISSNRWRRLLVGPLVAWTAVAATATVTVGWHRPGDVVGSLFLATAWHRVMAVGQPHERRLRAMLPQIGLARLAPGLLTKPRNTPEFAPKHPVWAQSTPSRLNPPRLTQPQFTPPWAALLWWAGSCAVILGAAARGVLRGELYGPFSAGVAPIAYLASLAMVLAGVGITVLMMTSSEGFSSDGRQSLA
jgi:hypothetical protein